MRLPCPGRVCAALCVVQHFCTGRLGECKGCETTSRGHEPARRPVCAHDECGAWDPCRMRARVRFCRGGRSSVSCTSAPSGPAMAATPHHANAECRWSRAVLLWSTSRVCMEGVAILSRTPRRARNPCSRLRSPPWSLSASGPVALGARCYGITQACVSRDAFRGRDQDPIVLKPGLVQTSGRLGPIWARSQHLNRVLSGKIYNRKGDRTRSSVGDTGPKIRLSEIR